MDVHVESRRHEVLTQRTKIAKRPPPYTQGIPDPSHVGELAELDACGRSGAQAARLAVTLVVRVAALKPRDLRVTRVTWGSQDRSEWRPSKPHDLRVTWVAQGCSSNTAIRQNRARSLQL
eukprot:361073-Chlamydomonas_euryale.AAC.4